METSGTHVGSRHHRSRPWHLKELRAFVCQIKISPQMCIGKKRYFFPATIYIVVFAHSPLVDY